MKKILIGIGIAAAILIAGFFIINSYIYNEKQEAQAADYKDAEYVIDGKRIKLENGVSETETAPGSASKTITRYFGNEVNLDLNDDGREDIVFLLTQETGGSGTFYYVMAALNTEAGYAGSDAVFLGDRIAPQTTEKGEGKIVIINYADRKAGEDFSVVPSVGKSIWLILDPETRQFGEVQPNFEGEADPSKMKLNMKTWNWINALYNDGREIKPKKAGVFTITFGNEGKFTATTDCNSMGGSFISTQDSISFSDIFSTKKYCEGSQELEFAQFLMDTDHYHFTSHGELILDLKFDSGTVVFK